MRRFKRFRVLLAALSLAAAGIVFVAGATPASAHDAYSNGCSYSPDSSYIPVYYNFHGACDRHDYCYHFHYYGAGYSGRLGCDNEFLNNMRSWCYSYYRAWYAVPARYTCYGVAQTYYEAVRAAGWAFF